MGTGEDRELPVLVQFTHLLGVQYLQKGEEQDGHEGGNSHWDDVSAPVDGHEDDDVGTPDKLKRQF